VNAAEVMKIPKNGTSRLSRETWVAGEVLRRYYHADNVRAAIEKAVSNQLNRLQELDPRATEILKEVNAEGIEE